MKRLFSMMAVLLAACASGVAPSKGPAATAHIEIVSLTPAPMSNLDVNPMLVAVLKYDIENYNERVDYSIAPLFASNRGSGTTFNAFDRISNGQRLTGPSGTVTIRYSADRELKYPELQRPVKLWFYLMERTSSDSSHVIGKTEAVTYTAGR